MSATVSTAQGTVSIRQVVLAYVSLTKPRIMTLLLTTTLAAALIALREHPLAANDAARALLATLVGGALASGGAGALNCYIDRDIDAVMNRTRRRALPAGLLQPQQVLSFGLILTLLSLAVMLSFVNPLAALLTLCGSLFYVVVYTMWLKRWTTQNIVIGGAAGAIPPLVGWAAISNSLDVPAFVLFFIILLWTPAHFWALALVNRKDYSAAGVPMLPSIVGEKKTKVQIMLYTLLVVGTSLVLWAVHAMGLLYLIAAAGLGLGFVYRAFDLFRDRGHGAARRMFIFSNVYLALLFLSMVIDRLWPIQ
ncbi:MAG TPA: heme o synthase [Chloroflexota bacterium]|nr:heme o synthase [Chloroflexota bacterium]